MIWVFIGSIIGAIIWGVATQAVIENKGYYDNWFWWGFFFGLIAFIVACTKPQNYDYSSYSKTRTVQERTSNDVNSYNAKVFNAAENEQLLATGGWRCSCGRVNARFISSCTCGKSKNEILECQRKKDEEQKQADVADEIGKAAAIKEYKGLLDAGVINEEEFEAKKKQLLGL